MHRRFIVIDYDTRRYPFAAILSRDVFRVTHLDRLHEVVRGRTGRTLRYHDNLVQRSLMQRIEDEAPFYRIYHAWIAQMLAPPYRERIRYSAHPKMRVHLAGTGSVSAFHRDIDITHRTEQINCFLPFTDVYDGCTLHIETNYGSGDFQPVNLCYGQALIWDGGMLAHGSQCNGTATTRVSCDFRFHPTQPDTVPRPWSDVLADRPAV
ncbi:hypothetical protein [Paraburkholderia mimosarum]|uniref:hypothetical protein n=1 Tax=Paraburkholderia mimosarum TaxID=312026 RepID=UPI00048205F2|nr:hypothetical protein [Paraburkholderia mimosarum]